MLCGKIFSGGQTGSAEAGCEMGALGFGSSVQSVHGVVGSPSKSCFTSCPSTVGKGNGSPPSANGILEMDLLFQRESTWPACKPLGYLDANAAEEEKSGHKLGVVCVLAAMHGQGGVVARGWCWEAPTTLPGTTIPFPTERGSAAFYGSTICLQGF